MKVRVGSAQTSTAATATLTEDQQTTFDENGFVVVENALSSAACAHYIGLIDALDQHHREEQHIDGDAFVEIRNAVAKEPQFLPLITHSTTFPLVAELMGPNIQVNTSHTMVRPPQPKDTAATFKRIDWHRDGSPYLPSVHGTIPWVYTKIGYFLTDLSAPGMGNLRVIPGSHQNAERPPTPPDAIDPPGAIEVTTKPGDAVIFQQRLWHSVGPNTSEVTRKNIYVGYCFRWLKPLDYVLPDPDLLDVATPIQRQLLGEYRSEMTFWKPTADELPLKAWLAEHTSKRAAPTK